MWGTYGTLWGRARSVAYWRKVVASGEWARLGVYAVEAYGIFKVCSFIHSFCALLCVCVVPVLMGRTCRLEKLLGVGRWWGITCSRLAHGAAATAANNGINNRFLIFFFLIQYRTCIENVKTRLLVVCKPHAHRVSTRHTDTMKLNALARCSKIKRQTIFLRSKSPSEG